jgi:uncharacterized membrane protein
VSTLIAVAYDDVRTAQAVAATLCELSAERSIVLDDIVIAERRVDGQITMNLALSPPSHHAGRAAAGGAIRGGLIGLLFLAPLLGAAIGRTVGGMTSAMRDLGIDDDVARRLDEGLKPGGAAVFALTSRSTPQKVLPSISPYGGWIVHATLTGEADAQLRAALTPASSAA